MAAQLTATKGLGRRGLSSCRVRATSSLPVPLSPVINTETLLGATRSIMAKVCCIFLEAPTIEPRNPVSRSLRRVTSSSRSVSRWRLALARTVFSRVGSNSGCGSAMATQACGTFPPANSLR